MTATTELTETRPFPGGVAKAGVRGPVGAIGGDAVGNIAGNAAERDINTFFSEFPTMARTFQDVVECWVLFTHGERDQRIANALTAYEAAAEAEKVADATYTEAYNAACDALTPVRDAWRKAVVAKEETFTVLLAALRGEQPHEGPEK